MNIPELFNRIHISAQKCGYEVYVVGGYVRDKFLGVSGKDIDFVVVGDAMQFADQLKKDLKLRKIIRYPRFGTFMFAYYGYQLEFVNARAESYSGDSRNPVTEPADLNSDLSRRDFTINAMAMRIGPDADGQIIDIFNGLDDLKNGIIRTPLEPFRTFSDDPLRMMRAIRFSCRFGFKIDNNTFKAITSAADRIMIVSQERITDEFNKILLSDVPSEGLKLLDASGLMGIILPEMIAMKGVEQKKKYHHKDVFYHTLEVLDNIAAHTNDINLRLAALFHDIGKPRTKKFDEENGWTFHGHEVIGGRMAKKILGRMRYSHETLEYVQKLTNLHLRPMALVNEEVTDSAVRRLIFTAGEQIDDLMTLCRADITSKNPGKVKRYLKNYDHVIEKIKEVEERDRLRNFQPPVNGNEIMEMFDLEPGPMVGTIKKFVEEAILNGEVPNEHDACKELILRNRDQFLQNKNPGIK